VTRQRLHGWGRTAPTVADVRRAGDADGVRVVLADARRDPAGRGVIARGLGRSYGDPAQNAGGIVLDLTAADRILDIDTDAAQVSVECGISLDRLVRALVPLGLWLPVLPGTRQVTVGGAIAADVHGKNHHARGSFGNHVRSMTLLTPGGDELDLTPDGADAELFWATVGGMGLTGVLLRATIALDRVSTAWFAVDTDRTADLDELLALMAAGDAAYPYSVAWFDSVRAGAHLGRGVLTRGRGALVEELPERLREDPLRFDAPSLGTVPDALPGRLVNRLTGRLFNELWFHKAPRHRSAEIQNVTEFFHPLDVVSEWNRVYGPAGFCQYQFVVPHREEHVVRACVEAIAASGQVSCLNVLKQLGPGNRGLLSFPEAGWTLAVDLPVTSRLGPLLHELDDLVLAARGRVYLAKDSRLPARHLEAMYPRLEEFRRIREAVDPDRILRSDLARRLDL
jgi:decaprenylphospho-beta-D-ribofuranose 2-oxidase